MGIILHGDNFPAGSAPCPFSSPAPNSRIQELQPHLQPSNGLFLREKHPPNSGNAPGGAGMGLNLPDPARAAGSSHHPTFDSMISSGSPMLTPIQPFLPLKASHPAGNKNIERVGKEKFLFYPRRALPGKRSRAEFIPHRLLPDRSRSFPSFPAAFKAAPGETA